MRVLLPSPSGNWSTVLLSQAFQAIGRAFGRVVSQDEAVTGFIMQSPSGACFRVTMSDAGELVVTPR